MSHTFKKWMISNIPYSSLFNIDVDFENPFPTDTRRDATLAAAFHCLMHERITENIEQILIRDLSSYDASIEDTFHYYEAAAGRKICVFYFTNYDNVSLQNKIRIPESWEIQDVPSKFTGCLVTNHTSKNSMVIFIPNNYNLETWHRLGALLPKYPAFEDIWAAKPLTEEELKMLKSLSTDGVDFNAYIKNWINGLDLRTSAIKKMFHNFVINNLKEQLEDAGHRRTQIERNVNDLSRRINDYYTELDSVIELINRLMVGNDPTEEIEKRLIEFLLSNKNVEPIKRTNSGDAIEFNVHAALDCWDNDLFVSYINNRSSLLYRQNVGYTKDALERFYRNGLLSGRFKIQGIAKFTLKSNGYITTYAKDGNWPSRELEDYFPNPHVDRFSCIGNHRRMLDDAAKIRDFEQGILIAIQITQSLNWADGAVMNYFLPKLFACNKPILADREGNRYTISQVMDILANEQEVANETN